MSNRVIISRFYSIPVHELYAYFSDAFLLERWCAPDGMTLRVPRFEAEKGGSYRYEHTNNQGTFVCEGHIRRLVDNQLIRMVDDEIRGPGGNIIARKLNCDITFRIADHGSEVTILQTGFESSKFAKECELGWKQCLDQLQDLVKDSGPKQFIREEATSMTM